MNKRITVAIATYNRSIQLSNLLVSLLGQTYNNWDLVIVDESEIESTRYPYVTTMLRHIQLEGHDVIYKRNDLRKGVGYIRNLTVAPAQNELVLRIDDDSILKPDYIEKLVKLIKNPSVAGIKASDIAAVGGLVPTAHSPKNIGNLRKIKIFNEMKFNKDGDLIEMGEHGGMMWKNPRIIKSHHLRSSFLFKKSIHDEVGGHPDWVNDTGYREESILSNKFIFSGYKLLTDPEAICFHNKTPGGGTSSPDYPQKAQRMDIMYRKWLKDQIKKKGNPFTVIK